MINLETGYSYQVAQMEDSIYDTCHRKKPCLWSWESHPKTWTPRPTKHGWLNTAFVKNTRRFFRKHKKHLGSWLPPVVQCYEISRVDRYRRWASQGFACQAKLYTSNYRLIGQRWDYFAVFGAPAAGWHPHNHKGILRGISCSLWKFIPIGLRTTSRRTSSQGILFGRVSKRTHQNATIVICVAGGQTWEGM